jgi:hypothetical protein
LPPGWLHPFFQRLHRVTADHELRSKIAEVLVADLQRGRHVEIPDELDSPGALAPLQLTPMLFELDRRRQMGLPWKAARDRIQALVAANEGTFFEGLKPTQRIVYSHLFSELEIEPRESLAALTAETQARVRALPAVEVSGDVQTMYAITHLIYAQSRYFRDYVDPAAFGFARPALNRVLRTWLAGRRDPYYMDVVAEVLVCRQLLRVPDDGLSRRARSVLNELQNDDGSWSGGREAGRQQTHATLGGAAANLVFPDPLNPSMPPPRPGST